MTKMSAAMTARCVKNSDKLRLNLKKPAASRPKNIVEEQGYWYETDANGRTTKAHGTLKLKKAKRSGHFQKKAGGTSRIKGDHGGHLLGARFGGSSKLLNTVAQHGGLNVGAWKKMENEWAAALKLGKKVEAYIELEYVGSSKRPDSFRVVYWINGIRDTQTFKNTAGQTL